MRISDWSSDVCSSDLFRKAPMALGPWRAPASLFCWLVAALSAAPVAALAWRAGWDGFAELPLWIGNGVSNSLLSAALAATVFSIVAIPVAHALPRPHPLTARFHKQDVRHDGLECVDRCTVQRSRVNKNK